MSASYSAWGLMDKTDEKFQNVQHPPQQTCKHIHKGKPSKTSANHKWAKELVRQFSKEEAQIPINMFLKFSKCLAIRKMQIKSTLIVYLTLIKTVIIKKSYVQLITVGTGKSETSFL